jgi:hypothetical protein
MTTFSISVNQGCSISLSDLSRRQFDSFPSVGGNASVIHGHKYWSKTIRMGPTTLHLHTDEPPVSLSEPYVGTVVRREVATPTQES